MKKKVTFYSPGTFVAECTMVEIEGDTITDIISKSAMESKNITERYNASPYAFNIEGENNMFYLPHHKLQLYDDIKKRTFTKSI